MTHLEFSEIDLEDFKIRSDTRFHEQIEQVHIFLDDLLLELSVIEYSARLIPVAAILLLSGPSFALCLRRW